VKMGSIEPNGGATEQVAVPWNEIEAKYWSNMKALHEDEDERLTKDFREEANQVKLRLVSLFNEKHKLELQLRHVQSACAKENGLLKQLEVDLLHKRDAAKEERDAHAAKMRQWFSASRTDVFNAKQTAAPSTARAFQSPPVESHYHSDHRPSDEKVASPRKESAVKIVQREPTGAEIYDSAGGFIAAIDKVEPCNQWIEVLLDLPIKRPIIVRPGRTLTQEHLNRIYEPMDTKWAKWIACMIQATGEVQETRCDQCTRKSGSTGTFSECIITGGELFPRCGNCEWARQRCDGPTGRTSEPFDKPQQQEWSHLGQSPIPNNSDTDPSRSSNPNHHPNPRPASEGIATPDAVSPVEELDNITRDTLILRHDGSTYTDPECLRGVPLEKIDGTHPYWDPSWEKVEDSIELAISRYRERYNSMQSDGITGHAIHLVGRQLNRGATIKKFLAEGEFSPYQLMGKQWITPRLIVFDTVFRLAQTLEELKKFNLSIAPSEWLRQRLHEIRTAEGDAFNLSKTIHNFYHDPKLAHLRSKNGFVKIGRPSIDHQTNSSTPPTKKRKFANTPTTGTRSPSSKPQPDFSSSHSAKANPAYGATSPKSYKQPKSASGEHDLEYDGCTDRDSVSGDYVRKFDWRIYQVKTRLFTTNTRVTQYWHWIDNGRERLLEHQVLKSEDPAAWGVFKDPIDFHLVLEEMSGIHYSQDSDKIIIAMKEGVALAYQDGQPRGDVLAYFKRDRTKIRFLAFCHKKGIKLIKCSS
jgi:hypothetical protein